MLVTRDKKKAPRLFFPSDLLSFRLVLQKYFFDSCIKFPFLAIVFKLSLGMWCLLTQFFL